MISWYIVIDQYPARLKNRMGVGGKGRSSGIAPFLLTTKTFKSTWSFLLVDDHGDRT